jgi:hypothetical protein
VTLRFGFSRPEIYKTFSIAKKTNPGIWFCLKSNLEKETSLEGAI